LAAAALRISEPSLSPTVIYIGEQNGYWSILKPDDKAGLKIIAKGKLEQGEEIHASAVASHGKVYIMTTSCLYCLADKNKKPGTTPMPPAPQERALAEDSKPAQVQVIPAEVLLKPGDKQQFKVRLFNSHGQLLNETAATLPSTVRYHC
jgi:hypothetical protein